MADYGDKGYVPLCAFDALHLSETFKSKLREWDSPIYYVENKKSPVVINSDVTKHPSRVVASMGYLPIGYSVIAIDLFMDP